MGSTEYRMFAREAERRFCTACWLLWHHSGAVAVLEGNKSLSISVGVREEMS